MVCGGWPACVCAVRCGALFPNKRSLPTVVVLFLHHLAGKVIMLRTVPLSALAAERFKSSCRCFSCFNFKLDLTTI
jgi:hypothetical protein